MADFSMVSLGNDAASMFGPQVQPDSKCFSFWYIIDTHEPTTFMVSLNDTNDMFFTTEGELIFCL